LEKQKIDGKVDKNMKLDQCKYFEERWGLMGWCVLKKTNISPRYCNTCPERILYFRNKADKIE